MDLSRVSRSELIAIVGGVVLAASLFLSWRLPAADQVLVPAVALLSAAGLLTIRRLSTTAQYSGYAVQQLGRYQ